MAVTAQTVASGTGATRAPRPPSRSAPWTGLAGLVFAAILVVDQALAAGQPAFDAPASKVARHLRDHRTSVVALVALLAVSAPALFAFASGVHERLRSSGAGRTWGLVGMLGIALLGGLFLGSNVFLVVLVVEAPRLAGEPGLTRVLWELHGAAFGLNMIAIGIALLGLSVGSALAGVMPRWTGVAGAVGAVALLVCASGTVAVVEGSALFAVGGAGFAVWLLWLIGTSIRLVRR
jgi:hypothetical protein